MGRASPLLVGIDHAFPSALDDMAETRFDENLRADLAKKYMAQLHYVKEATRALPAPIRGNFDRTLHLRPMSTYGNHALVEL